MFKTINGNDEKPIFNKCLIKLDNSPKMIKFNKIADTIKTTQSIEDDKEKITQQITT